MGCLVFEVSLVVLVGVLGIEWRQREVATVWRPKVKLKLSLDQLIGNGLIITRV